MQRILYRCKYLTLSAIILLATAIVSYADSDGYFCNSKNYIAYELNEISASEYVHILRIIFLGGDAGISIPVKIELDQFQTHGMKCNSNSIQIQSWDKIYQIDIANTTNLKITKTTSISPGEKLLGFEGINIGNWSRKSETVKLESDDKQNNYELVITKSVKSEPGIIHHKTNTEIQQKDQKGKIIKKLEIFTGIFEETID